MTAITVLHNISVTLAILLSALGLGFAITSLITRSHISDALTVLWISEIIGLGFLSVLTLILGLLGLLRVPLFVVFILILAVLGIYWGFKIFNPAQYKFIWKKKLEVPIIILIFIITSTLVWIFLTHALMPPHEWDEVAYHLALAKIYVRDTQIKYVPSIVTSNWPLNNTMLFCIALMFGADIAPHLIMFAMTLLILFGLVYFGYKFSDVYIGLVAAVLFITIPLTKRLAGTGLIDVSMGLYGIAALVSFEQWRSSKLKLWLVLCGLNTGFIAGTKMTGIAFILIYGIFILWVCLSVKHISRHALIQNIIAFGLSAALVTLPWYARSYLFTGNPIYPFGYAILDGKNWDALGDEYHSTMQMALFSPNLPRNIVGFIKTLGLLLVQPHTLGGYIGGLGVVIPLCFLIGIFFLSSAPRWIKTNTIVGGFFFIGWFLFASLQLRYLLPIAPLMAWSSAYLILRFYRMITIRQARMLMLLVFSFTLLIDWPWIKINEVGLFYNRFPYLIGQMTREQWLESQMDIYPVLKYANNYLPEKSKILLLPFENRGYYLDLSYLWGHPLSQRVIKFETFQDPVMLANTLHDMKITHIIDNPDLIVTETRYWEHDRSIMLALERKCCEKIFQQNNITMYKLNECTP